MQSKPFYSDIWTDDYFTDLTSSQRLLFIYLLFNPSVNIAGIYKIGDKSIMAATGLKPAEIKTAKERLHADGKVCFLDDYVLIVNHERYNPVRSTQQEKGVFNILERLPDEVKEWRNKILELKKNRGIIPLSYPSDTPPIYNNNINTKSNKNTNKPISDIATKALESYNRHFSKSLKSTVSIEGNLEFWVGHYTVEDIDHAFEMASRDDFWKDKITPEIMFRRKNPRNEAVDWIGTFSSKWKPKKVAASSVPIYEEPVKPRTPEEAARIQKMIDDLRKKTAGSLTM